MSARQYRIVMTDYDFPNLDIERREFARIGADFIAAQCRTADEVVALCRDADAVITEYYRPFDHSIIQELRHCQVIVRTGIGHDTIDLKAATEKAIVVVNVPAYCLDEVAEHTMALILGLARKLETLHQAVLEGRWNFKVARPLHRVRGSTLGIVGCGRIGRRLCSMGQSLGMQILVDDPYVCADLITSLGATTVSLEELLERSDIVTLHVPLTPETEGMIGEKQLRHMKPTAYLINTSRGPVVQHHGLQKALEQGWIAGAGLDVVGIEPLPAGDPLLALKNAIVTPHCAWYSEESIVALQTTVAEEVVRVLEGYQPLSVVNPEVLDRLDLKPPTMRP